MTFGYQHDRPTLAMMTRPGRKTHELRNAITREIHRLYDRDESLSVIEKSGRRFAADLAKDQRERIADRLKLLLGARPL